MIGPVAPVRDLRRLLSYHARYDGLQASYWQTQIARVISLRDKIAGSVAAQPGRVIPEDEDLVIGQGRRLSVAVLFLDISGFSSRLSETEAEQDLLLRVLNLFFSEMIKIAEDYGGKVEKNTGDGLMAYFESGGGDPPEKGCKRAVACALTMMAANTYLIKPILDTTSVPEITFGISIDYGTVTIARLGAARRFNANVAIGATANFACKMLSLAQPGDIVVGATVRDQLPVEWHQFLQIMPQDTGWSYRIVWATLPSIQIYGPVESGYLTDFDARDTTNGSRDWIDAADATTSQEATPETCRYDGWKRLRRVRQRAPRVFSATFPESTARGFKA